MELIRGCQIFTGVIQGTKHFQASLAIDRICKFHLKSGVSLIPSRHSRQGIFLRENPFILVGESSQSPWWCCNVTSLFGGNYWILQDIPAPLIYHG